MTSESVRLIESLCIDHELVLEFFAFFSRFEYSLKRSRFLKVGEKAEVNWDKYANSIRGKFAGIENLTFQNAVNYLMREPPRTQIIRGNELDWRYTVQGPGEHHECYILRLVRTIRNNLFHGGKYPHLIGPIVDDVRNRCLLQAGLTVLTECLTLSESVRYIFEEIA